MPKNKNKRLLDLKKEIAYPNNDEWAMSFFVIA